MSLQPPLFKPQTEWVPPESFPDLSQECEIAIDLETKDPNLNHAMGSGSIVKNGNIVGHFCRYSNLVGLFSYRS